MQALFSSRWVYDAIQDNERKTLGLWPHSVKKKSTTPASILFIAAMLVTPRMIQ
jgi:hypothetical protein